MHGPLVFGSSKKIQKLKPHQFWGHVKFLDHWLLNLMVLSFTRLHRFQVQGQFPFFFRITGIYIYMSQSLFFWFFQTMDTKIEQLPSEARNTCWWYVAVCVHKIWNLSTKEGSLFVLFFWDLPKHSAFYNLVLGFCLFLRHAMSQYGAPIVLADLEIFMNLFFSFLKIFHAACS